MDMGQPEGADRRRKIALLQWVRGKPYEFEAKGLFGAPKEEYGDKYADHLLELYKFYADTACQASGQRVSANTYFLTLNSTIIAILGLGTAFVHSKWFFVFVPFAGVLVCWTWARLISSYRNLNRAKYHLLFEIEEHLPVALYRHEWDLLKHGKTREYKPLSFVERSVPIIFSLLYVFIGFFAWFVPLAPSNP